MGNDHRLPGTVGLLESRKRFQCCHVGGQRSCSEVDHSGFREFLEADTCHSGLVAILKALSIDNFYVDQTEKMFHLQADRRCRGFHIRCHTPQEIVGMHGSCIQCELIGRRIGNRCHIWIIGYEIGIGLRVFPIKLRVVVAGRCRLLSIDKLTVSNLQVGCIADTAGCGACVIDHVKTYGITSTELKTAISGGSGYGNA